MLVGDQVDRGGYEQQWIDYYNYVPSLGNFLQATFDFLIIAFSIFLFIRLLTKLTEKKKEEQTAPAPAPAPSEEVKLLSEIRDLLKKNEE